MSTLELYNTYLPQLLDGLKVTIYLTIFAILFGTILGLISALFRLSKIFFLAWISKLYTWVIRGIPLVVQLFFWYYGFFGLKFGPNDTSLSKIIVEKLNLDFFIGDFLRLIGIDNVNLLVVQGIFIGIWGLSICEGAYMSEIFRAGINSIDKGQREAAYSLGMTKKMAMKRIVLPQAFRVILPPFGSELITSLKDTALVSITISVVDLSGAGKTAGGSSFRYMEILFLVGIFYLIISTLLMFIVWCFEKKFGEV